MNVADDGGPSPAPGGETMLTVKGWETVPCELVAVMPQPGMQKASCTGKPVIPLNVPVPFPLSVNVMPGIRFSSLGSAVNVGAGEPVVVTVKLTGDAAVPSMRPTDVIMRCGLTSISIVFDTGVGV